MLRVMTLNINYYVAKHGAWAERSELIRRAIQTARPDIVALQAVEADPEVASGLDQATQLAQSLPEFQAHFQPAMPTLEGGMQGSAFLSRLQFARTTYLPLTRLPDLEDTRRRVICAARFDLASGPLHVLNAHFSWVPVQARLNLVEALPFMSSFSGLALLVGDLNNTPDCEPMQMIREAGWTDVWAQLHPNKSGYTYESPKPTMRIDYAWANPRLAPAVRAIEMVAEDAAANGVQASDHLGLVITLDLDPSPARA